MRQIPTLLATALFVLSVSATSVTSTPGEIKADTVNIDYSRLAPHPRLLLRQGEEKGIKDAIVSYPSLKNIHDRIMATAEAAMSSEPVMRIMEGKRLLHVSREALQRIFYLSYAYRMTGNEAMARRAEKEMNTVCDFIDWNPKHFLDVGEMTMGLAIGYDWLFDILKPETKVKVRNAIIEKAFRPASDPKYNVKFYGRTNNWNSVCNSGLTYGALALYESAPAESDTIIRNCLATNPKALGGYGPDGGYPEGYMYWGYGTSFQAMLCDALETSLGTDFGLSQAPGFLTSARFMLHMTAPSGQCFNFSDCPSSTEANMMLYWFADKLNDPSVIYLEKKNLDKKGMYFAEPRLLPCLLIFASRLNMTDNSSPGSCFWFNRGATPVFTYRSGWNSPHDTFLGVKGGKATTSHAHMDAGSFVYERNGVRWAMDLGMQNYYSLESKKVDLWNKSQNSQRWDVFRLGNLAHNTITVNDFHHIVSGKAEITDTLCSPESKGAVLDMTPVFGDDLQSASRKVILDRSDNLIVTDILTSKSDREALITWVMVTPAEARIKNGNTIELTKDGGSATMTVSAGKYPVNLHIWDNKPVRDFDADNPGTRRVGFITKIPAAKTAVITVKLQ